MPRKPTGAKRDKDGRFVFAQLCERRRDGFGDVEGIPLEIRQSACFAHSAKDERNLVGGGERVRSTSFDLAKTRFAIPTVDDNESLFRFVDAVGGMDEKRLRVTLRVDNKRIVFAEPVPRGEMD